MKHPYILATIVASMTSALFTQDCHAYTIQEKIGTNLLIIELDNGTKKPEFLEAIKNFEPKQEMKNAYNA